MTFQEYAVSATYGDRALVLVTISHPTFATVLRYVDDTQDWTIGGNVYSAMGVDADFAPTDDSGVDSRSVTVPDPDLVLWRRLEKLSRTGDNQPVTVTFYVRLVSDTTVDAIEPSVLRMASPSRDGRMVTFEASTVDTVNRDAPSRKFTWANSPGLRR